MSAITNNSTGAPANSSNPYSALSSGQFLEIMITELANQDPLSPSESKDLLNQIGTIRSIESDLALKTSLESLVKQNELSSAGSLVGKYVTGLTTSGVRVEGLVMSVKSTRQGAQLNLSSNHTLPFDRIEDIIDPQFLSLFGGGQ